MIKKCWRLLFGCFLLIFQSQCYAETTLIVEPDMGRAPILNAIKQAHSSIDVIMYGFNEEDFTNALIKAHSEQKSIRVLLQQYPFNMHDENAKAIKSLQAANINLHWPDEKFSLLHQKTFLLDGKQAMVLTFNLTPASFTTERNFGLIITDSPLVAKIQQVFNADWQHTVSTINDPDLVYSPGDSRQKILALLAQAHANIKIYSTSIADQQVVNTLVSAIHRGVKVCIVSSIYPSEEPNHQLEYLQQMGANIHYNQIYQIHAKVILVDDKLALLGSNTFTKYSIDKNRELSIIIHDPKIITQLTKIFAADLIT